MRLPSPSSFWPFHLTCMAAAIVCYLAVAFLAYPAFGKWVWIVALGGWVVGQLGTCEFLIRAADRRLTRDAVAQFDALAASLNLEKGRSEYVRTR